jgi:hypothetical protein
MNKITIKRQRSDIDYFKLSAYKPLKKRFAAVNTPENLSNYISQSFNVKQLTESLKSRSSFYLAV